MVNGQMVKGLESMTQKPRWRTCLPAGRIGKTRWTTYSSSFMYHVYAIKSLVKNYVYVGMTNNLGKTTEAT